MHESLATLNPDSEFLEVFPDGNVPVISIIPIIPGEIENPPCYLVDAQKLNEEQINKCASRLFEIWSSGTVTYREMVAYVRSNFPIETKHFRSIMTTNHAIFYDLIDSCNDDTIDDWEDVEEEEDDFLY